MTSGSWKYIVVSAALIALAAGADGAPRQKGGPVPTGPGTTASARKFLEGRWSLITYDIFPPGREPIRVTGQGVMTFDGFGNLDAQIRVDKETSAKLDAVGIPTKNGVLSITGRAAVDLQAKTLTYFFQGQPPLGAPSNPLALNRPRHWDVEGNTLTLTTKDANGKALSVGKWQKM